MRHLQNKVKFTKGADATRSSVRKLIGDFVRYGKVSTTVKRAKATRSKLDRLISRSIDGSQSGKDVLERAFGDMRLVNKLIAFSSENFKKKTGGYVRLVRLGTRQGDNAEIARIEWIVNTSIPKEPIKIDDKELEKGAKELPDKKETKKTESKKQVKNKLSKKSASK